MKRIEKRQLLKLLLFILIIFVFSIFFALFLHNAFIKDDVKYELNVSSNDSLNRVLKYNIPVADQIVLASDFSSDNKYLDIVEFDIDNTNDTSVDFDVYIIKNKSTKEISESYVKFCLLDENNTLLNYYSSKSIPVFDELDVLSNVPGGHVVYRGNINSNTKKTYKLVSWVSDKYTLKEIDSTFNYTVVVKSR